MSQTQIYTLDGNAWYLVLDGIEVPAAFNSKGAAKAAIKIERKRRQRKGH